MDEGVTFSAGLKLESGCWLWCIRWFWSQLRDADGQITFFKKNVKPGEIKMLFSDTADERLSLIPVHKVTVNY